MKISPKFSYDAIVIGGGPAGATAAYFMARAGIKTALLEKGAPGRPKCCGGGVSSRVKKIIDFDLSPCWETVVRGAAFSWRGGDRRRLESGEELGWLTRREVFDLFLQEAASRAGAEVRYEERLWELEQDRHGVTAFTEKGPRRGRVLVGADGAGSVTARRLNLKNLDSFGFGLEARLEASARVLEDRKGILHFDFGGPSAGYCWIFPRRDHLCAGVAVRRPPYSTLKRELKNYLDREGLSEAWPPSWLRGAYIRGGLGLGFLRRGRCLLAGDAAGLCDQLTGEGIYPAILSGRLAAEAAVGFLAGGRPLSGYDRSVRGRLRRELVWANLVSRAVDLFPRKAYELVFGEPERARSLFALSSGRTTYGRLLRGRLRSLAGSGFRRPRGT